MLLRILIVLILAAFGSTPAFSDKGTVLVFPFENQSGDRNLDWIGEGIAELIIERLRSEPELDVTQRDERLAGFEKLGVPEGATVSRATSMKLGWDTGSDRLITGRFATTSEDFSIYARIVDLAASGASQEIKVTGKLEDVIPLTNTLGWQILKLMLPHTLTPESDYTTRPPIPRSAFENYIRGILSTDPRRRNEFFENAIRLYPQYSAAQFQLGRSKHLQGDFKASNQVLEKIVSSEFDYSAAQFLAGLNYFRLGDFTRSASILTALSPTYDVLVNLGVALSAKGDAPGAIAAWGRAADREPLFTEASFNIGYLSFTRGDNDLAAISLEQVLKLQGRDAEALFLLAKAYERLGRTEDSQRTMSQATRTSARVERWLTQPIPKLERLRPTLNATALRNSDAFRVWTVDRLGRRSKGQELTVWLDFIQTQVDSQLYGEATRELKDALMVFPNSSDAHILMAQIHERQKSFDQAVKEYELSIGLRPAADTYVMLARAYRSLNQTVLALRAVEEALKLEPDHVAAKVMKAELQRGRQ